jgi:hypothetical protein
MNPRTSPRYSTLWRGLISLLTMCCFLLMLSGCNNPRTAAGISNQPTDLPGPTVVATATTGPAATATLSGPDSDATKLAIFATVDAPQDELSTRIAQGTPIPTPIYVPLPVFTPHSVWTPTLGISGECAQGNHVVSYGGCWTGLVSNQYLFVHTGAFEADPSAGFVRIFTATLDLVRLGPMHDYISPLRVGRIRPSQVAWPIMTLVTVDSDPQVYLAFDLSTRQWVPATPVPSPTLSQSPIPSP